MIIVRCMVCMPLSLYVAWYVRCCHCTLHGMYAVVIVRCMVCMLLSLYVAWYVCCCHCTLHDMYAVVIVLHRPHCEYAKQRGRGDAHGRTSQGAVDCWQQRIAVLRKWERPLTREVQACHCGTELTVTERKRGRCVIELRLCRARSAQLQQHHRQPCEALAKPALAP